MTRARFRGLQERPANENAGSPKDRLRPRLLVVILGIPALVWITWLGGWAYALFVAAVVLVGLREYLALLRKGNLTPRPIPTYLAAIILLIIYASHAGVLGERTPPGTLGLSLLAVLLLLVMVLQSGEVLFASNSGWLSLSAHVAGVLWIAGFGGTFILVRSGDLPAVPGVADVAFRLTMALYVSVWICDALAYGMGRRYGRRKIIPRVSPNKTVVGTVAGVLGALATMLLLGAGGWLPGQVFSATTLVVLGLIVGVAGQMGDFVESRLKRDFNVKDTGALLPGHGGVLDRFDSLLFVMPLTHLFLALAVPP